MHGGRSTGPRTLEGLERVRAASLEHGRYSAVEREAVALALETHFSMPKAFRGPVVNPVGTGTT
jgi:hypothetical protein